MKRNLAGLGVDNEGEGSGDEWWRQQGNGISDRSGEKKNG